MKFYLLLAGMYTVATCFEQENNNNNNGLDPRGQQRDTWREDQATGNPPAAAYQQVFRRNDVSSVTSCQGQGQGQQPMADQQVPSSAGTNGGGFDSPGSNGGGSGTCGAGGTGFGTSGTNGGGSSSYGASESGFGSSGTSGGGSGTCGGSGDGFGTSGTNGGGFGSSETNEGGSGTCGGSGGGFGTSGTNGGGFGSSGTSGGGSGTCGGSGSGFGTSGTNGGGFGSTGTNGGSSGTCGAGGSGFGTSAGSQASTNVAGMQGNHGGTGQSCVASGPEGDSYRNLMTQVFTLDKQLERLKKQADNLEGLAEAAQEQMDTLSNQVIVMRTEIKWVQAVAMLHAQQSKIAEMNLKQHNKLLTELKRNIDEVKGQLTNVELQKCRRRREAITACQQPAQSQQPNNEEARIQAQINDLEARAKLEANEVRACENIAKAAKNLLETSTTEIASLKTKLSFAQQEASEAGKHAIETLNRHRAVNQQVAKLQEERDAAYAQKCTFQVNMNSKRTNTPQPARRMGRQTLIPRGRRVKRESPGRNHKTKSQPHLGNSLSADTKARKKECKDVPETLCSKSMAQMLNGGKDEYRKVIQLRLLEESRVTSESKEVQRAEQSVSTSQKQLRDVTEKSRALKSEIAAVQLDAERAAEETKKAQDCLARHEQLKFKARKKVDSLYAKLTTLEADDCNRNKRSRRRRRVVKRRPSRVVWSADRPRDRQYCEYAEQPHVTYVRPYLHHPRGQVRALDRSVFHESLLGPSFTPTSNPRGQVKALDRSVFHESLLGPSFTPTSNARGQMRALDRSVFHESLQGPSLTPTSNLEPLFHDDETNPAYTYDNGDKQRPDNLRDYQQIPLLDDQDRPYVRSHRQNLVLSNVQMPHREYVNSFHSEQARFPSHVVHSPSREPAMYPPRGVWNNPVHMPTRQYSSQKLHPSFSPRPFNHLSVQGHVQPYSHRPQPRLFQPSNQDEPMKGPPNSVRQQQPTYWPNSPVQQITRYIPSELPVHEPERPVGDKLQYFTPPGLAINTHRLDHVEDRLHHSVSPEKQLHPESPVGKESEMSAPLEPPFYEHEDHPEQSQGLDPPEVPQDRLEELPSSFQSKQQQLYNYETPPVREESHNPVPQELQLNEQHEQAVGDHLQNTATPVLQLNQLQEHHEHLQSSDNPDGQLNKHQKPPDGNELQKSASPEQPLYKNHEQALEEHLQNSKPPELPFHAQDDLSKEVPPDEPGNKHEETFIWAHDVPGKPASQHEPRNDLPDESVDEETNNCACENARERHPEKHCSETDPEYNKVMQEIYVSEAKVKMEGVEVARAEKELSIHHRLLDASLNKLDVLNKELANLKREGAWATQTAQQAQAQLIAHDTKLYNARKKVGAAIALETDIEKYMATHSVGETGKIREALGAPFV